MDTCKHVSGYFIGIQKGKLKEATRLRDLQFIEEEVFPQTETIEIYTRFDKSFNDFLKVASPLISRRPDPNFDLSFVRREYEKQGVLTK